MLQQQVTVARLQQAEQPAMAEEERAEVVQVQRESAKVSSQGVNNQHRKNVVRYYSEILTKLDGNLQLDPDLPGLEFPAGNLTEDTAVRMLQLMARGHRLAEEQGIGRKKRKGDDAAFWPRLLVRTSLCTALRIHCMGLAAGCQAPANSSTHQHGMACVDVCMAQYMHESPCTLLTAWRLPCVLAQTHEWFKGFARALREEVEASHARKGTKPDVGPGSLYEKAYDACKYLAKGEKGKQ